MNIIIVGCGKVGTAIAEQLNAEEEHNVTVVDILASAVKATTARCDSMGVVGNGATHAVQMQAGIDRADLLIAVTGSDELNLLCCLVAKKFGNCQTIARIKNPSYSAEAPFLQDELGLAMVINPQNAAAEEMARVLRFPAALMIDTFAKGRVELIKFRLPETSPLVDTRVRDLGKLKCDVLVCTVEREDEVLVAHGDLAFRPKDVISIVATPANAAAFFDRIGYKSRAVRDVLIAGGGDTAQYLCEKLQAAGIRTKVIERNFAVCEELAERFPAVSVIHGDAADQDLLIEEGLPGVGAFVALTNIDEENILLSLFAKSVGSGITLTKINRIDFDDVIKRLDLDSIIYPKNITADLIVRYVRAMNHRIGSNVETLYHFIKDKAEAAEFLIREPSAITGKPLAELKLKKNILIAAILRGDSVIIPRGHDSIEPGDAVVIIAGGMPLGDVLDALER